MIWASIFLLNSATLRDSNFGRGEATKYPWAGAAAEHGADDNDVGRDESPTGWRYTRAHSAKEEKRCPYRLVPTNLEVHCFSERSHG